MEEASSSSANGPRAKPRDFALARLARRDHSEGELAQKMTRAGYHADEIEQTLSYLRERRYVNDATFARDFCRARAERRRWGPARIEQRLRLLELSEKHIEAALSETFPDIPDKGLVIIRELDFAAESALSITLNKEWLFGGEEKEYRAQIALDIFERAADCRVAWALRQ